MTKIILHSFSTRAHRQTDRQTEIQNETNALITTKTLAYMKTSQIQSVVVQETYHVRQSVVVVVVVVVVV